MKHAENEAAEPDLVLISNLWVLVVEVKLDSGLGKRQPWREYLIGKQIARDRNLRPDSVRYLVVSRSRLDVGATFGAGECEDRNELLARTYQLRWSDVVSILESWLRHGKLACEHTRLLEDLLNVMKRRRTIAFSGFSFANQEDN